MSFDAAGLARLQQDFVDTVLNGTSESSVLLDQIVPILPLQAAEALEVYQNDYFARLSETLTERFASLRFMLGPETFAGLALDFLQTHRSQHYDLGQFGHELPLFLAEHPLQGDFPFLVDLARLELAYSQLFHAPLQPAGDLGLLAEVPDPGKLCFELIAPLQLFCSDWPLREIWNQRHHQTEAKQPSPAPQNLLLYKNSRGIRLSVLNHGQFQILQSLQQGLCLSQAIETLNPAQSAQLAEDITQLFALLRQEELIAALRKQL